MKPNLLTDVLHEGAYPGFREQLLQRIEIEARRRRLARAGRWLALAAAIVVLFALNRVPTPNVSVPVPAVPVVAHNPIILRTAPLKSSQILQTRPVPNLVMITTDHQRPTTPISDSELLALFPKKPVGLASTLMGARRLLFLDPADERRFMSSN